jgi:hypothetical protein
MILYVVASDEADAISGQYEVHETAAEAWAEADDYGPIAEEPLRVYRLEVSSVGRSGN